MIKFCCHNCHKKIGVQDMYAGRKVFCPRCSMPTAIPKIDYGGSKTSNPNENTQYSVKIYHGMANEKQTPTPV